jgi:hypothetical protein
VKLHQLRYTGVSTQHHRLGAGVAYLHSISPGEGALPLVVLLLAAAG